MVRNMILIRLKWNHCISFYTYSSKQNLINTEPKLTVNGNDVLQLDNIYTVKSLYDCNIEI